MDTCALPPSDTSSRNSYCGGLPAPESADNALKYKFSWNPRAVLNNTVGSARWMQDGQVIEIPPGGSLMDTAHPVDFLTGFNLEGIPNRDSLHYKEVYGIGDSADTIIRGTLRYRGFCDAMKGLIEMGLMNGEAHPLLHPAGPDLTWKQFICRQLGQQESILMSNLRNAVFDKVGSVSRLQVLEQLGLLDDEHMIDKRGSALDTVSHLLSNQLAFSSGERDVAIMRHEIGIELPGGSQEERQINLVVYGDPNGYTAMAKCVGYPLGIATRMILDGEVQRKGVLIPVTMDLYHPLLSRLNAEGISAVTTVKSSS